MAKNLFLLLLFRGLVSITFLRKEKVVVEEQYPKQVHEVEPEHRWE